MTVPLFGAPQEAVTSDDYYTPAWLFEDMGLRFDLDVAAPPGGVPWVPADRFFTKADDGLSQEWVGRVWMNPPFSGTTPWVEKFMAHQNGVALLPIYNNSWMISLWKSVGGMCFFGNNFHYVRPGEGKRAIMFRCGLWAVGDECVEAIGRIGHVR